MGTLTGALPLPAFGTKVAAKSRVDYQNTPEGALVQRAQAGDESAFREIVERYQSKVLASFASAMMWKISHNRCSPKCTHR